MTALLAGALYVVIGVGSVALDWRIAAWFASGVVAAAQIWFEHFRRGSRPLIIARNAAVAVAIGAFGLALNAYLHSGQRVIIAFVAWPLITAVPAFVAALIIATVLARLSPRAS